MRGMVGGDRDACGGRGVVVVVVVLLLGGWVAGVVARAVPSPAQVRVGLGLGLEPGLLECD